MSKKSREQRLDAVALFPKREIVHVSKSSDSTDELISSLESGANS